MYSVDDDDRHLSSMAAFASWYMKFPYSPLATSSTGKKGRNLLIVFEKESEKVVKAK